MTESVFNLGRASFKGCVTVYRFRFLTITEMYAYFYERFVNWSFKDPGGSFIDWNRCLVMECALVRMSLRSLLPTDCQQLYWGSDGTNGLNEWYEHTCWKRWIDMWAAWTGRWALRWSVLMAWRV